MKKCIEMSQFQNNSPSYSQKKKKKFARSVEWKHICRLCDRPVHHSTSSTFHLSPGKMGWRTNWFCSLSPSVSTDTVAARLTRFTLQASVCVIFPQLCLIRRLRRDAGLTTAMRNNSFFFFRTLFPHTHTHTRTDGVLEFIILVPSVFYLRVCVSFMFTYSCCSAINAASCCGLTTLCL